MRVLIIAIPRSGSTSLIRAMSLTLKLNRVDEPFNDRLWESVNWDHTPDDNVVVKSLMDIYVNNRVEFFKRYSKLFDKTIILSRHNLKEVAESYAFQIDRNERNEWHSKYKYTHKESVDKHYEFIYKQNSDIIKLSKELKIEMDWYEDLYSGERDKLIHFINKHDLGIDVDTLSKHLDPKGRLRQIETLI
tara:strand:+ start:1921 stop:2490 length:570 start_codon:yes stop_codon:yes gene_type:complete